MSRDVTASLISDPPPLSLQFAHIHMFSLHLFLSPLDMSPPQGDLVTYLERGGAGWGGTARGTGCGPPVAVSAPAGVTPGSCAPSGPNIIIISQCHSGCPVCWMPRYATQRQHVTSDPRDRGTDLLWTSRQSSACRHLVTACCSYWTGRVSWDTRVWPLYTAVENIS